VQKKVSQHLGAGHRKNIEIRDQVTDVLGNQQLIATNNRTSLGSHSPMNSPFSRERSGQKEARIVCNREASFKEDMRVKYPLASVVILKFSSTNGYIK